MHAPDPWFGALLFLRGLRKFIENFQAKGGLCPLARSGLTPEDIFAKMKWAGGLRWIRRLFGQVTAHCLADQQRDCGKDDIFGCPEHACAGADDAGRGSGPCGDALEPVGVARPETCEMAARGQACAQAASIARVWRERGGLAPAQIIGHAPGGGEVCGGQICGGQICGGRKIKART